MKLYFNSRYERKHDRGHLCLCYPATMLSSLGNKSTILFWWITPSFILRACRSTQKCLLLASGSLEQHCSCHCDSGMDRDPIRRNEMKGDIFWNEGDVSLETGRLHTSSLRTNPMEKPSLDYTECNLASNWARACSSLLSTWHNGFLFFGLS